MLTRFLVGLESSCKDWKHVIAGALDVEVGRLESSCKDWKRVKQGPPLRYSLRLESSCKDWKHRQGEPLGTGYLD